uniref:W2 domain-containing protein n=1 Tax=Ciona savignyi TaxID=51511 RepID=H2Z554_CIOSA
EHKEAVFRKTRSILNKLTPEKFDKLCQDILNIGIASKEILKGIVILIFEKAIDELRYSSLYANLCRRLYYEAPNFDLGHPINAGNQGIKPNTFRRLLIAKLQDEFENRNRKLEAFDCKEGALSLEEEEQRSRAKHHMLGNIKFIGELYRLNLLHESIVHKCIMQLIRAKKKGTVDDISEDLECLCQIMVTCGRRLDHDKAKSLMDQYFDRLELVRKRRADLPSRIRFMIQDVLELRAAKWMPRQILRNVGPKTLGQIRSEVAEEYPGLMIDQPHFQQNAVMWDGFSGPLSPPLMSTVEPTSPGNGFDFFSPPPQVKAKKAANPSNLGELINNGSMGNSVAHQMNGGHHMPYMGYPMMRNGYPPNMPPYYDSYMGYQQEYTNPPQAKSPGNQATTNAKSQYNRIRLKTEQNNSFVLIFKLQSLSIAQILKIHPPTHTDLLQKPNAKKPVVASNQEKQKSKKNIRSEEELAEMVKRVLSNAAGSADKVADDIKAQNIPNKQIATLSCLLCENSLQGTDEGKDFICQVFVALIARKLANNDHLMEGLQHLFEKLGKMESSVPRVKSTTSSLLARFILNDLATLKGVSEMLKAGYHFPMFLLILQQLIKIKDKIWLLDAFKQSKVDLLMLMPDASQNKGSMFEILKGKQLAFLCPLLHMEMQLSKQLDADPSPMVVYRWIKENVGSELYSDPEFVHVLTTCCLHHVTKQSSLKADVERGQSVPKQLQEKEKVLLSSIKPVLQKFVHDNPRLQLHALYTVQTFCHDQDFPKGLMLRMFNLLYNEDVIDEESFIAWKEDVNSDFPGKGKALFQVNSWLTWLQEADTEEDDE